MSAMYKRYEPNKQTENRNIPHTPHAEKRNSEVRNRNEPENHPPHKNVSANRAHQTNCPPKKTGFFTKFIPSGIYNPDNGKIFGLLSPEDLLLIALILVLLDNSDESEDNTLLILALVYILASEYVDLPI